MINSPFFSRNFWKIFNFTIVNFRRNSLEINFNLSVLFFSFLLSFNSNQFNGSINIIVSWSALFLKSRIFHKNLFYLTWKKTVRIIFPSIHQFITSIYWLIRFYNCLQIIRIVNNKYFRFTLFFNFIKNTVNFSRYFNFTFCFFLIIIDLQWLIEYWIFY